MLELVLRYLVGVNGVRFSFYDLRVLGATEF
jgi:hypothetical protein